MITTYPAHPFKAAKQADPNGPGLIDNPGCGHHHTINTDGDGVFCARPAGHRVHNGEDMKIRVHDWTDEDDI